MNTSFLTPYSIIIVLLSLAVISTSCDNPADSHNDHDHGHTEPYGLELVLNGETVVKFFDGEVTGSLQVDEGAETSRITVDFLNKEGEHIHKEDLDEEYSLDWNIEKESVVSVEQHDEDGKWSFHLVGHSAGESRIQFRLLHGDHADFETPATDQGKAIKVVVDAQ